MSDVSSRIARSNILKPLAKEREKERQLIKAGKDFDGLLVANWSPNETNANHFYWDEWNQRIRKAAGELEAAGETEIAGQLLTFFRQIDGRDEVTCVSDFRFEEFDAWLAAVMAGDTGTERGPDGDQPPVTATEQPDPATPANVAPDVHPTAEPSGAAGGGERTEATGESGGPIKGDGPRIPVTPFQPPGKADKPTVDDPITLAEVSKLVLKDDQTIYNNSAKWKSAIAVPASGRRCAVYFYSRLRPLLLETFPDSERFVLEDYQEARKLFSQVSTQ